MKRIVEIRSYALKPGEASEFHSVVTSIAVPMLRSRGLDVVAFGPSPHDPDSYFLVRAFDDLTQLRVQEDAFYSSDSWRHGTARGNRIQNRQLPRYHPVAFR